MEAGVDDCASASRRTGLRHLCVWADLRSPQKTAGRSRGKPRSISDAQQVFPFAKVAPEAHAFRDLECRDHTPFDLLAGLDAVSVINGPPSLPPRRRGVVLARLIESGLPLQRLSSHEANERNHRQPRHYQMGQMQADLIG